MIHKTIPFWTRLSGFFYLMVVLTGLFGLMYIPGQLIDLQSPAQTLAQIVEHPMRYRWWIVTNLLCYSFFFLLGWSLYQLLYRINRQYALIMVSLVLCSVPLSVGSTQHLIHALSWLEETGLGAGTSEQIELRIFSAILAYRDQLSLADLFWSTWLFPLGYLVYRSGFLPGFLGIVLMIGSVSYFLHFLGGMLYPDSWVIAFLRKPASVAEITTCLWLLIIGPKKSIDYVN